MHPDLSPHLHTEECNLLINELKACHEENKFRKFLGVCNDLDKKLTDCLRKERQANRQANYEKSKRRQQLLKETLEKEKLE
ncbi:COX assembly mitochondrial protein 2 homolog isoform X2 [Ischnura elegans]|uniref:COX assembly mitochondrial protein 2 homolog isoform X2 n=1 Tax=Ischnura elegans TaxID=197161 RepID=UPI001ED8BC7C|nr:COX assembly mitochondrial protein 2 homolog isoform X2 [Ischnura elegans]XP_046394400.1 COX assembly mitochondrial protein 2 homolog isoform X2 [Ischnura elegans]